MLLIHVIGFLYIDPVKRIFCGSAAVGAMARIAVSALAVRVTLLRFRIAIAVAGLSSCESELIENGNRK